MRRLLSPRHPAGGGCALSTSLGRLDRAIARALGQWRNSVGVAPQLASALGRIVNCQTLALLTLARGEAPVMAGLRLSLQESRTGDQARLERAGGPAERCSARAKSEIALAELDRLISAGVRFGAVLADAGHGMSSSRTWRWPRRPRAPSAARAATAPTVATREAPRPCGRGSRRPTVRAGPPRECPRLGLAAYRCKGEGRRTALGRGVHRDGLPRPDELAHLAGLQRLPRHAAAAGKPDPGRDGLLPEQPAPVALDGDHLRPAPDEHEQDERRYEVRVVKTGLSPASHPYTVAP